MKRLTINTLMVLSVLFLVNVTWAKSYKISGSLIDITGELIPNTIILLLDNSEKEIASEKTNKKGFFQFKKIDSGDYLLKALNNNELASLNIVLENSNLENIELTLSSESISKSSNDVKDKNTNSNQSSNVDRVSQDEYVLTEISFELKKMSAELDHLSSELRDLKARSEMWINPLSIYQKEIILNNGSTVFGKIVYQDEETLKVETLVGFLVIDRSNVVRIVENVMAQEDQEYVPEQIRESYSPPPMPKLAEPRYVSDDVSNRSSSRQQRAANIVLVGNIVEKKDKSNNVTFTGQVKNVGGQRADFVKVNFVLRKNWSGETRTLTSFVSGSYYTFDSGITTDASLLPGANGGFELIVPSDIGSFLGYSYTIDWEEYE